jgi:small subunit ribosomal protein S5
MKIEIENFSLTEKKRNLENWTPKTDIGQAVKKGEITTLKDALSCEKKIVEVEVFYRLLPEVIQNINVDIRTVRKTTRTGRIQKFRVLSVVGNGEVLGFAMGKDKELAKAISKAKERAIKNLKLIEKGCGRFECNCGKEHSIPATRKFVISSLRLTLIPAPIGSGKQLSKLGQKIAEIAQIKDLRSSSIGNTQIGSNYAKAIVNCLLKK